MNPSPATAPAHRHSSLADLLQWAAAGVPIITASRRLARTLLLEFASRARATGSAAWRTPQILPWSAWIESLWDSALYRGLDLPARLDADQELLLWERIIADTAGPDTLLDLPAAAEATRTSWQLVHAWRLDLQAIATHAGDDSAAFLAWARKFDEFSRDQHWCEAARWPNVLASCLERITLPPAVVLAGFEELTPQQQLFLDACRSAGVTVTVHEPPSRAPQTVARIPLRDPAHEIETAARWARALLEQGCARSIGIIVPDLESRRTHVERIFRRVLEPALLLPGPPSPSRTFNVAAPPPLISYPLVRAALLALELDPDRNSLDTISRLLRSSFFMAADSECALRARLDAHLRDLRIPELSIQRLRSLCKRFTPECKRLRLALLRWQYRRQQIPERQSPGAWARDFSRLLHALGWPGERSLNSDEFQTLQAWNEALARLARLDGITPDLTFAGALGQFRRILARTPFQPEGPPAPIQILGLLEAAGLEFDALWICGLDEDSWPSPPAPDPFLPIALQRKHGLPHSSAERELDFARRLTARLRSSAPLVIASWPLRVEDQDRAPSPLIRDWPEIRYDQLPQSACPDFVQLLAANPVTESREELQAPPVQANVWSRGGSRVFQYQALCPFRAFAQLRLGAAALRAPEPGLQPLDRGQAVHAALEYFWRYTRTQARLCALSQDELDRLLDEVIQAALARIRADRSDLGSRLLELEHQRLKDLLAAWLELERQRPEPFEVVALEEKREIELAGVRATIKVDRVDRLEDGRDIILDYKTGRCSRSDWKGERPSDPQLPLYAVTHQNTLAAVLYAQTKTGKLCFSGLYADRPTGRPREQLTPDHLAAWRRVLAQLAESFRSGYAAVDPKDGDQTCRNCGLDPFCRVHEAPLYSEEEEETA